MGLNISHGCWDGSYSAFMTWRTAVAKAAGLPPLELMEGFYAPINREYGLPTLYAGGNETLEYCGLRRIDERLPIRWSCLKPSALHELLRHSDCEGEIPWESCGSIADALEALLPALDEMGYAGGHIGMYGEKTRTFIEGLRLAFAAQEKVEFC